MLYLQDVDTYYSMPAGNLPSPRHGQNFADYYDRRHRKSSLRRGQGLIYSVPLALSP